MEKNRKPTNAGKKPPAANREKKVVKPQVKK